VARFRDKPLDFPPGTSWSYSNSGYVLLGYLIERISGVSYARFVHDNLLAPLGMKNSGYDSSTGTIPRHATGYAPGPSGPVVAGYIDMSIPFSAGALYSTTGDLLLWERGLFGGKVLKAASLQKMTTPFKNHYAFGLDIEPEPGPNGGQVISHGGGIEGFNTQLVYVTSDKLTVIVLANLNGAAADRIATDLRRVAEGETVTLISDRVPISVSAEVLDRMVGHYKSEDGLLIAVSRKGDRLRSEGAGMTSDLYPQTEREFFSKVEDLQFVFSGAAPGPATELAAEISGHRVRASRIDEAEAQRLADALGKKIHDQTPTPGGEAALRRSLELIAAGTPDYDRLGSAVADATRQQLPQLQPQLQRLGKIESIDFKGVGPMGADIYTVRFENGALEMRISLGSDGRILSETLRPLR
jgi:hypothetical protein